MRYYDVIKYLKKLLLIISATVLLIIGFMGVLVSKRKVQKKGEEIAGQTVFVESEEGVALEPFSEMAETESVEDERTYTVEAVDPERVDISEYLRQNSPDDIREARAIEFLQLFKDNLRNGGREFFLSNLNRGVIESSFYHINEDAFIEEIYRRHDSLNAGAEVFLTGLYPVKGSDGFLASAVQVMKKTGGEELEYDYENQQIMSFTLYFDNNEVSSYLPFAEYTMRQYATGYGLSR